MCIFLPSVARISREIFEKTPWKRSLVAFYGHIALGAQKVLYTGIRRVQFTCFRSRWHGTNQGQARGTKDED
jgi:hypothetical protein